MILSIDPGNVRSAWLWWNPEARKIEHMGIDTNDNVLNGPCAVGKDTDLLAIEMVQSFGMAVGKEVFETVWWTGRFCQRWGRTFERVHRTDVKLHLCHNTRAKDGNVRQALIDLLGPAGTKKAPGATYGVGTHLWAALGVAITASARLQGRESA